MLRQAERSETGETGDTRPSRWRGDLVAYGLFLAAAVWVMGHLWLDPGGRLLRDNGSDQQLFEWMLAHTAEPVEEIAARLGYVDTSNFSRTVRRWFGVTPRELRESGGATPAS